MTIETFAQQVHPQWREILHIALQAMSPDYLQQLANDPTWLPGRQSLFAAFNQPLESTRYILLGESPYPRAQSANGYAFWDAAVMSLWSETGLSKEVNRATSLRNLIKMLLYARGDLQNDFSQSAISKLNKATLCKTGHELFSSFIQNGFLLMNASLVYSEGKVPYHAKQWRPFMASLLTQLAQHHASLQLILWGIIAELIPEACLFKSLVAEHPYNISFITNPEVFRFFKPLNLLQRCNT